MGFDLYPWGGDFVVGNPESPVAAVTLGKSLKLDPELVAVFGPDKTENLGIEKVVANIISNPGVRFLILCGPEVRGHMSGDTLRALYHNGIDDNNKVVGARGAVPYIENIPKDAIERFQKQVELVDLVGEEDVGLIEERIRECIARAPGPFGEPYIVIRVEEAGSGGGRAGVQLEDKVALHSSLALDPYGEMISLLGNKGLLSLHRLVSIDAYGRIS